jgi:hypothetical protein
LLLHLDVICCRHNFQPLAIMLEQQSTNQHELL